MSGGSFDASGHFRVFRNLGWAFECRDFALWFSWVTEFGDAMFGVCLRFVSLFRQVLVV